MSPSAKHDAELRRDLHRIRCFVRVVETGSINRAARHLGIAQSALSRCVRELELSLGAPLLDRGGRGSCMTRDGHRVYEAGRRMVQALESAELEYCRLLGKTVQTTRAATPLMGDPA
ncbi:LysR family transcriptional regulator [Thiomonas sp. FB-6]|uniref:LysR family transcriptional regulator n=1 Tax=Thiomonas sp. FB-6 TaxID=1158291 RepID=UPI00036F9DF2|nr:LysR family transcriptional regulator [Thiomonas sp. FB-6]